MGRSKSQPGHAFRTMRGAYGSSMLVLGGSLAAALSFVTAAWALHNGEFLKDSSGWSISVFGGIRTSPAA